MLNKQKKQDFKELEKDNDGLNNEKLIVEKELEQVREQLEDFKKLVNHLTSSKLVTRRNDERTEHFVGFLNSIHPRY